LDFQRCHARGIFDDVAVRAVVAVVAAVAGVAGVAGVAARVEVGKSEVVVRTLHVEEATHVVVPKLPAVQLQIDAVSELHELKLWSLHVQIQEQRIFVKSW